MIEVKGNIWDYYDHGNWIVITTNGVVHHGRAVMGKGVAFQARVRHPLIPEVLGYLISLNGNVTQHIPGFRVIAFPTKDNWREKSSFRLIERSCEQLVGLVNSISLDKVCMPRPGCKNGRLNWEDVKPILEKHLDDRFIVVEWKE